MCFAPSDGVGVDFPTGGLGAAAGRAFCEVTAEELTSDMDGVVDESASAFGGDGFGVTFGLDGDDDLDGVGGGAESSLSGSGLGSSIAGESTRTVGTATVEDVGVEVGGTTFGLVRAFLIAPNFDSLSESLPSVSFPASFTMTLAFEGATFFFDSPPVSVDVDPSVAEVAAAAFGLSSISLISEVESFADSVTVRFELLTLETIDLPVLSGEAPAAGFFFVDRLEREPPLMASDESLVEVKQ